MDLATDLAMAPLVVDEGLPSARLEEVIRGF